MAAPDWEFVDDETAFTAAAGAMLLADPVRHTVILGALEQLGGATIGSSGPATWALLRGADAAVLAVAWRTPPFGLGLTEMSPATARALADAVAAAHRRGRPGLGDMPSVVGVAPAASACAARLAPQLGRTVRTSLLETLYQLDSPAAIIEPRSAAGRARAATDADLPELTDWWAAFVAESGVLGMADHRGLVARRITAGQLWVWLDATGRPCSLVGARATGGGVAKVGPVYTPPADRGRGFAASLTAHVSHEFFADGCTRIALFADDANGTSTGIYRRLGFVPVLAWADIRLEPGDRQLPVVRARPGSAGQHDTTGRHPAG